MRNSKLAIENGRLKEGGRVSEKLTKMQCLTTVGCYQKNLLGSSILYKEKKRMAVRKK